MRATLALNGLIKGDEKTWGKWNIRIFQQLNKGIDGIIRSVKVRARKRILVSALSALSAFSTYAL